MLEEAVGDGLGGEGLEDGLAWGQAALGEGLGEVVEAGGGAGAEGFLGFFGQAGPGEVVFDDVGEFEGGAEAEGEGLGGEGGLAAGGAEVGGAEEMWTGGGWRRREVAQGDAEDVGLALVKEGVADGTEEEAHEAVALMGADDDEVGLGGVGHFDEVIGGVGEAALDVEGGLGAGEALGTEGAEFGF